MAPTSDDQNGPAHGRNHNHTTLDVDPDILRQTGARIRDLAAAVPTALAEPAWATQTTVGHPGLAAALNEFLELKHRREVELADHLDAMATQTERAAQRYENTDTTAAHTLDPP